MTRKTGAVAALLATALLAGCSAGAAAGSPSGTAPVQYSPTTTTRAPAEQAADEPVEPRCTTGETSVATALPTALPGFVFLEVVVGALGSRCSVDGYPTVRLFGPAGARDVALAPATEHEPETGSAPLGDAPVSLDIGPQSGDTTAFYVQIPDAPSAGPCHAVDGFAFSVPGGPVGTEVGLAAATSGPTASIGTMSVCGGRVLVSAYEVPMIPDISG